MLLGEQVHSFKDANNSAWVSDVTYAVTLLWAHETIYTRILIGSVDKHDAFLLAFFPSKSFAYCW